MCRESSRNSRPTPSPTVSRLNAFQRRQVEQQYEQAMQRMEAADCDRRQVHQCLANCASADPASVQYGEALLRNLARTAERGAESVPSRPAASLAALDDLEESQDWGQVLKMGLELLWDSPRNGELFARVANACLVSNHPHTALLYAQGGLKACPEHAELNRLAARALTVLERFDQAIQHWRVVEQVAPRDDEPPRWIAALIVEQTRRKATNSGDVPSEADVTTENDRPQRTAAAPSNAAEPAAETLKLTPRQRLEQAITRNPQDETAYLQLADYYEQREQYFEAQQTLSKGRQFCDSPALIERWETMSLLRAQQQVDRAQHWAQERPTSEAFDLVEQREAQRRQLEFRVLQARSARHPENKSLQFQWGVQLKRQGKLRAAVEPLQAGLELPEHRAEASLEIGEILQRFRQFPKALQCYRQAAQLASPGPGKSSVANASVRNRALYRAGLLSSEMGLNDSARAYLSELVRIAGDYKDARPRLDKLSKIDDDT